MNDAVRAGPLSLLKCGFLRCLRVSQQAAELALVSAVFKWVPSLRGNKRTVPHLETHFETAGFRRAPMCDLTHLSSWGNIPSAGLTMLYNALFSLTAIMFCLSLFLTHRVSVLEKDFQKLRGDISQQLNQQRSEGVHGKLAKTSKTREVCQWLCIMASSWTLYCWDLYH